MFISTNNSQIMKIAILTQPLHKNYGGILQAYALQTFLEKYGHEVVVVNRDYNNDLTIRILLRRLGSVVKSFVRLVLMGKKEYVIMNPLSPFYHSKWSGYNVLPFVNRYIKQSMEIRSSRKLKKYFASNKFDCYIVGSDQIWRPCYSPSITDYFLKEIPEGCLSKRIAYAASFGTEQWEFSREETYECAELLKLFDAVSVREKSGVKLCRDFFNINAVHLLDPTMLLDEKYYTGLFSCVPAYKNKYNLFCYILDESAEARNIIRYMENDGYTSTCVSLCVRSSNDNPRPYQLQVEEWLQGIYNADFVITDSFHACVFAILFKKPFLVIGNKLRGNARFDSLLEMFKLENRMVTSKDEFIKVKASLLTKDDIFSAQDLLVKYRMDSISFFKQMDIIQ